MKGTPYSPSCGKTVRRFYDDFDMLPFEYKELIWNSPCQATFADLKAAWEMAAADKSLGDLIKQVNCMKPSKEELKAQADRERERKKQEKYNNRKQRYVEYRPVYGKPQLRKIDPKQARLVQRVTEEQLEEMLAKRNENKDVKVFNPYYRPIVGYEKVTVEIDPTKTPPEKPDPPQSIIKMMHNAGGKKSS